VLREIDFLMIYESTGNWPTYIYDLWIDWKTAYVYL